MNDVIDKLQQELANIEQKVPADIAALQEDADSLKHTLETVVAEKEALEKQVENVNVEASRTKNELEETKLKMTQLEQEISVLKKKRGPEVMRIGREETEDRSKGRTEKVEEGLREKSELLGHSQLQPSDESAGVTVSKMELQLEQLQECIKERDSELCQSYSKIKGLEKERKAEREILEKRILELEKTLLEKVAAALVSQVQLNAVQEQRKFMQEIQQASSCVEDASRNARRDSVSGGAQSETESKLALLTQRLGEMEDQLALVNHRLELERENARGAEKEAKAKEEKLFELQQLLQGLHEKHSGEAQKQMEQEETQPHQVLHAVFACLVAAKCHSFMQTVMNAALVNKTLCVRPFGLLLQEL